MRQKGTCPSSKKSNKDDDLEDEESIESDLILIGLVGIMDPPGEKVHDEQMSERASKSK